MRDEVELPYQDTCAWKSLLLQLVMVSIFPGHQGKPCIFPHTTSPTSSRAPTTHASENCGLFDSETFKIYIGQNSRYHFGFDAIFWSIWMWRFFGCNSRVLLAGDQGEELIFWKKITIFLDLATNILQFDTFSNFWQYFAWFLLFYSLILCSPQKFFPTLF